MTVAVEKIDLIEPQNSPFSLDNTENYARWRDWKLKAYPADISSLMVEIDDPYALTLVERSALLDRVQHYNMVVYSCAQGPAMSAKDAPRALGKAFGLARLDPNMLADDDGISSLAVVAAKSQRGYIPYTNRRILWHADGYYNPPERQIRAMILHCVRPALTGGENSVLDHEMAYLLMREQSPNYIDALMQPDVMTIPANAETDSSEPRPAQSGPVFSIDPKTGVLHMRYTARTRSIEWKQDARTQAAVAFLEKILADETSDYVLTHRLEAGQGLLCNNVLHSRTAFEDGEEVDNQRLLYRARYYDRIQSASSGQIENYSRQTNSPG